MASSLLHKITLKNFQSIKNEVEIEFAPITLLVGPNSAGKSAIFDALEFAETLYKNNERETLDLLNRWGRKESGVQTNMHIGFALGMDPNILGSIGYSDKFSSFSKVSISDYSENLDNIWIEDDEVELFYSYSSQPGWELEKFTASIAGEEILSFSYGKEHTIIRIYLASFVTEPYDQYEQGYDLFMGESLKLIADYIEYTNSSDIRGGISPRFDSISDSCKNFKVLFNEIYDLLTLHLRDAILTRLPPVPANRTTPLIDDLIFVNGFDDKANIIRKKIGARNVFFEYICSLALKKYHQHELNKLNQYLGDEIFHGNGYQIYIDVSELKSINPSKTDSNTCSISILKLIDSNGSIHHIQDVGSGIGYLLPILAALVAGGFPKIQQPELHMHPALQGSIADVFVDVLESNDRRQINFNSIHPVDQLLIETHSEHIILRLLKFIRNKEQRKSSVKEPFSYKDLSVIYFQPDIANSCTKIKRLRVAPDGTFVDEWPDGFFMERYKDIFDE